jgi:ABC-2 type transport system ATP-binding protein
MLKIQNLTKIYPGGKKAVDDFSLTIEPGELYGFIGPNGAGKTTTLKCCSGILQFDQGEILIGGKSIQKEPVACKRMIAYIPDNPDLYDYLTGNQYLNFICDLFEISQADRQSRIPMLAEQLEIAASLGDLISSYSHGMKQKLALISAFVHKPDLLILDEPFVGLDPKAFHTLKELMNQLCKEGSSVFFSSHVLDVVEKICDKVSIIKNGRLIRSGKIDDFRSDESLETIFLELVENESN